MVIVNIDNKINKDGDCKIIKKLAKFLKYQKFV